MGNKVKQTQMLQTKAAINLALAALV